jgi:ABC-type transport system involved in multi-copper enzyme maturation permease subunit
MEHTAPVVPRNSVSLGKRFARLGDLFRRLVENPVIRKELRGRMRGRQGFVLLMAYLLVIGLLTVLIYSLSASEGSYARWDPGYRQGVGKAVFGTVVLLELTLVSLIGPALTSGAIAAERERQTFDLLRTTLLSARSLVIGKLGSSLAFLFLLIFSALPIQSIAFLLGGVGMAELLVSSLLLVVTAVFFCALGLFFSSFLKRTTAATVSSYAAILLTALVGGAGFLLIALSEASYYYSNTILDAAYENLLNLGLWLLIATNPLLAAIFSEMILVEEQNLFYTNAASNSSLIGSNTLYLPSPWILFTLIYFVLAAFMVLLSVYFVKRPER